jgi:hypothetical protein
MTDKEFQSCFLANKYFHAAMPGLTFLMELIALRICRCADGRGGQSKSKQKLRQNKQFIQEKQ